MPNKTIAELAASGALAGTDVVHIVDGDGNSRKMTLADLKTFVTTDPTLVPSSVAFRGALVRRTSALSIANSVGTNITWQDAVYNTDSIWSAGAPTRLTVPTGVTKIRLGAGALLPVADYTTFSVAAVKNGSVVPDYPGFASWRAGANTMLRNSTLSGVIPVIAGDYFEARFVQVSGAARDMEAESWFSMEIIEATI